ncbi:fibronectin type III-like domain-contianing protein [Streptomyces sp. NPDC058274]|uniref:fibronectin type III-like domain-contianing protein n=1 Tax=Streptomyces sp. NPDC058274 TaxID=3346416 RepID=UPI0036EC40F9
MWESALPERWPAGWAAVRAAPGERGAARIRGPARALRNWAGDECVLRTEPGPYHVSAGRSAGDLPLTRPSRSQRPTEAPPDEESALFSSRESALYRSPAARVRA